MKINLTPSSCDRIHVMLLVSEVCLCGESDHILLVLLPGSGLERIREGCICVGGSMSQ